MKDNTKEHILFVDDEKSILDVAREFFQHKGYTVSTAQNGMEAIEILNKTKIDCCFTDLMMPHMDGLSLAEYLRENDNTIPVVIMTAYPSLDNTLQTLKNGVVDFLIKPVNLNQMEICVRRVLRERRLFVKNLLLQKEIEGKERVEMLNQELQYKVEELKYLNKILVDFAAASSTHHVFQQMVNTALEVVRADESHFYLIGEDGQRPIELIHSAGPGNEPRRIAAGAAHGLHNLILEVAADTIPLLVSSNDGQHDLPREIRSLMLVPLHIRNKVFGILTSTILSKAQNFTEKDLYYLSLLAQNASHAIENLALYENIYQNLFATLYAFVSAIEARDPYTRQHSSRVTVISMQIGKEMGLSQEELDILNFAGHLHDIGKLGIRDDILMKPGKLLPAEFEKIKEHPIIGANIIERLGLWNKEKQIIRHHHERYDGTGYPDGLEKENIPFLARILSVADVYDAIASDRAYRKRLDEDTIERIMLEGRGTQFDPDVIDIFFKLYHKGSLKREAESDGLTGGILKPKKHTDKPE